MNGILGYTEDDVVSNDFVGDARYVEFAYLITIGISILRNPIFNLGIRLLEGFGNLLQVEHFRCQGRNCFERQVREVGVVVRQRVGLQVIVGDMCPGFEV